MPTSEGPLTTVAAAGATAARHTAQGDAERRLHTEVVTALVDAGFCRRFAPERLGGEPATFRRLADDVARVGEGCASAAWLASLLAHNGRFARHLPRQGQDEVWAKGPDTRIVSGLVPRGSALPTRDGWELSGTWPYVSGVEFSDWALLMATPDSGGGPRFFAVPRETYTIEDTWHTLGMRATGSHSLTLEGVPVPAHRSFSAAALFEGRPEGDADAAPVPLFAVNGLTFATPVLGAARTALALSGAALTEEGPRARESARIDHARAAGHTDAAALLLARVARAADEGDLGPATAARSSRDSALAVELLAEAVDRLFRASGTRGQDRSHPLQRVWRDVRGAAGHAAMRFDAAALRYTQPPGTAA